MNKQCHSKRITWFFLSVMLLFGSIKTQASPPLKNILCTTFPIYQITRNITNGREGVFVDLMLPSHLGCPHDYTLSPKDLQKIGKANLLVINGLGLEEFLEKAVERVNPDIPIIDTSIGIPDTLSYNGKPPVAEHDSHPSESDPRFEFSSGLYELRIHPASGKQTDIKVLLLESSGTDSIRQAKIKESRLFEKTPRSVQKNGTVIPGTLYNISANAEDQKTGFSVQIKIDKKGSYTLFSDLPKESSGLDRLVVTSMDGTPLLPLKSKADERSDHHHGDHDSHDHSHLKVNPHLFTSPLMRVKIAENISKELSRIDPNGTTTYYRNLKEYSQSMKLLSDEMTTLSKRFKIRRIVQPHGVFDYIARDMGLEITASMQMEGREPSASEMMELVQSIREKKAGAIFTEPQYPEKIGNTISLETSVPVAVLDPVATGPKDAPLDYYERMMRKNMTVLETILGGKP